MSPRRPLIVGVVLLAASVLVWATSQYDRGATAPPEAPAGNGTNATLKFFRDPAPLPSISARDLDGRAISSADWRGKVTIVNFWATWCGPCRVEIPALIALQEKYREQLQIIGVSQDEGPPENVRRFAVENGINYPIVIGTAAITQAFPAIEALPTTYIANREGRIVQKHVGQLNALVTELETRALAGLSVNASIEQVDRIQKARLDNNAQATVIPGVDLAALSPGQRQAVLQTLNTDACTCGCDLTLAKCRIDDPSCGVSLPLAKQVVARVTERK